MLGIGDKVKIRPRLQEDKTYGGMYFSPNMKKYRGQYAIIKNTETRKYTEYYRLDIDEGVWLWSKEMFVNGDTPEECKFKIGDKVIGNEKAEHYGVTKTGYIGEVIEIFHNGNFRIKGEKGDTWNVSMSDFDLYEEEKQQEEDKEILNSLKEMLEEMKDMLGE